MRRILAIALLGLVLAAPAVAQDGGGLRGAEAVSAKAAGLRGVDAEAPATPADDLSALIPAPPPVLPIASARPADSRQCRLACAREYYFCLAADEDVCPPLWSKCTARCGAG